MTQEYTPVAWQDETTSQQGTLINAERLNQMQTAHHYADGLEEVDAIPTADPGVSYHKIVYCTADSTIYRWDGTEWTKDIDDETKALLQQEIARATAAEGGLAQDIADEATARETADTAMQADISALESGKLDKKTASPNQWQVYGIRGSSQIMINAGLGGHHVPLYGTEEDLLAKMPTLGLTDNTVVNYGWATAQIGAEATARADADTALGGRIDTEQARAEAAEQANAQAIANTYTKAEIDTALGAKADVATTYTKTEADALLALKADQATTYTKSETDTLLAGYMTLNTAQTIPGAKTFSVSPVTTANSYIINNSGHKYLTAQNGTGTAISTIQFTSVGTINLTPGIQSDGIKAVTIQGQRDYAAGNTTDVATIKTLDQYTPMVRTTGNQTKSGTMTFLDAIYGRLIDPLYEEYSGALPSGKYRIFARIPSANTNSMIVLDAMVSANGGNFGYGRMIIGNPTTTGWFCRWVLRKSGGYLSATSIQIAREVATGDLVILALNPTYTGLAISLVYSKAGSSIHGAVRVTKVTSSADYALDGTDTGLDNIVPGSDMA